MCGHGLLPRLIAPIIVLTFGLAACDDQVGPAPTSVPAKLAFTVQPGNTAAGGAFTPAVAVTVEDSLNHVVSGAGNAVTVKIDTGEVPLSGTTTLAAVNGVATFADLSLQKAGSGYFLIASSPGLGRATSVSFDIAPASPSQLAFIVQPNATDSAAMIAPAVQVAILDAFANSEPNATNTVTIAIGDNPGGATLSGATTVTAVHGIATFSDLSLNQGGNGYTLAATASGLAKATSASFNIRVPLALAAVSAGAGYTCGITKAGAAYCWGANSGGALGIVDTASAAWTCLVSTLIHSVNPLSVTRVWVPCSASPVAVSGGLAFRAVSAGGGQTCGFTLNGAPYCWGTGELGNGTTSGPQRCVASTTETQSRLTYYSTVWGPCSWSPLAVSGGLTFVALSTDRGGYVTFVYDGPHTCGLTPAGAAYCWGANRYGQLGTGDTTARSEPVLVSGGLTFVSVVSGGAHTCGLTRTGAAYCWGYNGSGELGDGTTTNSATPVVVSGGLAIVAISAGASHTCGITSAGSAYCWGYNGDGSLGNGTTTNSPAPVAVSGGLTLATISAGTRHTCGVTVAGSAYCWGYNGYGATGELGDGTATNSAMPVAVSGGIVFTGISAGGNHTCGVTAAGAVYCWGLNRTGQLGTGAAGLTSYSSVPVRVH